MLVKLSVLLLLTKVWRTNSSGGGGGIRVKQTSDGAGNLKFKLSMKDEKPGEEEQKKSHDIPVRCDFTRGCLWKYGEDDYNDFLHNDVLEDIDRDLFGGSYEDKIQKLEHLYSITNMERVMVETLSSLALVSAVQALDGGDPQQLLEERLVLRAVEFTDQMTRRSVRLPWALRAARLSSLLSKLLLGRGRTKAGLYQTLGEFLFLEGRLLAAREAFLLSLREEGEQDLRLSLVTSPASIIKAVLCRAIEDDYEAESSASCPSDSSECPSLISRTPLNSVFWPDLKRSVVHEKLEWWLAKSVPMLDHYSGLHDSIYQAGELAGVYLSRYQRPINAVEGLRAQPVWTDRETGVKESLDRIRENWKVIRDEGLELMKDRRAWGVDPGWRGMRKSRGWWGEIPVKGVALHKSSEQAKFCQNAMFTCRLIQQFPQASGCPKCKAAFSLVEAGTVIPAHAGPTNTRLRAHLGLVVPKKGDLHMRIANKTVTWKPGKWTIIDDSFEHEIINDTEKPRLILIIDFHHPDISREQNRAEFNWSKEKMIESGLARSQEISGGFP